MKIKPHCPDFKPKATAPWLCAWWDWEHVEENKVEWFCSRPAWDYRVCETNGNRDKPVVEVQHD